eukprot:1508671-Lingulodinium_polyedra.AAC.1
MQTYAWTRGTPGNAQHNAHHGLVLSGSRSGPGLRAPEIRRTDEPRSGAASAAGCGRPGPNRPG